MYMDSYNKSILYEDALLEYMTPEELLDGVTRAMDKDTLCDIYAYICRVQDIPDPLEEVVEDE